MSKDRLIPDIRFPDYINYGEWQEKKLILLAGRVMKKNKDGAIDRVFTNSAVHGIVDQREYFDKDIANKSNLENYYVVEDGDYVYNPRISNEAPVGPTSKNKTGHTGVMSPLYTVFRFKNRNNEFYEYYFNSIHWYDSIRRASNTGARFDRMSITDSVFMEIPILHPHPQEQQKIASCLSSLDELIAAHSDKLTALKDHKKGLMQNLFPQEGETIPKIRFKEFGDDGEWVEKKLGNCLLQKPEYGINAPAVPYSDNLPKYIRITDISEDGKLLSNNKVSVDRDVNEDNYLNDGDIALARTGASVGKSYKYREKDGRLVFAGFLIRVRPDKNKLDSEFLFQFLSTSQYWEWVRFISVRSGQPGINGTEYASMPINLPPTIHEQQKIASCLSALDELISFQTDKIEQLQQHKKGMMQGLFPNPSTSSGETIER